MARTSGLFNHDRAFLPAIVAGCDEAGRGPLAGPVVCAVCCLPLKMEIQGIDDSKKLTPKQRERLYKEITAHAIDYQVAVIDTDIIEQINILNATKLGAKKAIEGLQVRPDIILTDALSKLDISFDYRPIIHGDALSYNIAAASIIAKVTRDALMSEYDAIYPGYGFAKHKGYATSAHIEAIKKLGTTPIHRPLFLRKILAQVSVQRI